MHADKVLINGNIITMKSREHRVSCAAIKDGKIIWTGSDPGHIFGKGTDVVDLKGYTVVPGFFDSHHHIIEGAKLLMYVDLRGCGSLLELRKRLMEKHTGGNWITGTGWDDGIFEEGLPEQNLLDMMFPDRPMFLIRRDGHCVWMNTMAFKEMKSAGFNPTAKGSSVVEAGSRVGLFFEEDSDTAVALFMRLLPMEFYEKAVLKANELFLQSGITSVNDMVTDSPGLFKLYRKLMDDGRLKVRVYCGMRHGKNEEFSSLKHLEDDRLRIGPVKYFLDGTFGSRTAMLFEPYEGSSTNMGVQVIPDRELDELIADSIKYGRQIAIHAIGDRAVNLILSSYEKARSKGLTSECRSRIEHIQIIRNEDIERFEQFGIIPSFQPCFLYERGLTVSRVGEKRLKDTYRFRSFFERGIPVIFNSDYPYGGDRYPEKCSGKPFMGFEPILGIHAASSSVHLNSPEKVSPYQALRAYTVNGAYVNFAEDRLGTIEDGKLADMTVLSGDILAMDSEEIINTRIAATIVNGEIVYNNGL